MTYFINVRREIMTKTYSNFIIVLFIVFFSQHLFGADGRIQGFITDATTNDVLQGANVIFEGTSIGTATDLDGAYLITDIPPGSYTVSVSYIGYQSMSFTIEVEEDQSINRNISMNAVVLEGEEIVVTAQAEGQYAAINKQLSSGNIVNVVSSARIQELPDDNAAESIGRLPGISLIREGGQATKVVVRGLQPQYNSITIDGVQIPANDAGNISAGGAYAAPSIDPGGRGVNLSMISSYSLAGIEVYKTMTPDMDAAVLGGTVNFGLREAKGTASGAPSFSLLAQGGYNDLMATYSDYKFVASVEQRFFNDKLGIFVQGIAERQSLTSDRLGGTYWQPEKAAKPDSVVLGNIYLSFIPRDQRRYEGILSLDYRLPDGKISLFNLVSHGTQEVRTHDQTYNLANFGNSIQFGTEVSSNKINVVTNILSYEQNFDLFNLEAKLSNSYSDNGTPEGWRVVFSQISAGTNSIPNNLDPIEIARRAAEKIDLNNFYWQGNSTWSSFNKQNDTQGSISLERSFNFSDAVSVILKGGGQYRYTTRYHNFDNGYGSLYGGAANGFRYEVLNTFPWLAQPPYDFENYQNFPMKGFYDPNMDFGKFFEGDYGMYSRVNDIDAIDKIIQTLKVLADTLITTPVAVPAYIPGQYSSKIDDYHGNEFRSAEYLMATIKMGSQLTITPGVRYQGLRTSYTAPHFDGNADANVYPSELKHTWVTKDQYHGYWLPHLSLKFDLYPWLSFRGSYTNTLAYPDYYTIVPKLAVSSSSGHFVVWNNYALKPAHSTNYDFQVAVYNNEVGLFAVTPFLKRIDNLIFSQSSYITDPSKYEGVPESAKTFSLTTFINNPEPVDVWGIEGEWQTHFWYLPGILSGLVLNVNYTHIFSEAQYPYTKVGNTGFPLYQPIYIDTTYQDRLINQPNDILNLSIGFDYKRFSILVSMIYQSKVYNSTHFYNSLRSDKNKYLRWDISVKQGLPWFGLEAYLNVNDLNSERDSYLIRGSGFPSSQAHYGLTAYLGLRWRLE